MRGDTQPRNLRKVQMRVAGAVRTHQPTNVRMAVLESSTKPESELAGVYAELGKPSLEQGLQFVV